MDITITRIFNNFTTAECPNRLRVKGNLTNY